MKCLVNSCFVIIGSLSIFAGTQNLEEEMNDLLEAQVPNLMKLYRHFHAHPELSLQERETARRFADELEGLGFQVTRQVGGHGVVGLLRRGEGKTLMIRTDLDALPIVEKTDLDFASKVCVEDDQGREVGVMHACGHDVHMCVALGTAAVMAKLEGWQGTLMVIGQPAEEICRGAYAMLGEGLFDRFGVPDAALALHVHPSLRVDEIGITSGYTFANVDTVTLTLYGHGGHGAQPHTCIDPVVMAAKLIVSLQTLVSREVSPTEPAVVTVGSIHGGTRPNIIPDQVELQLTVRSLSDATREKLLSGIKRMAHAVALGEGMEEDRLPDMKIRENYAPSVYNDPELTAEVKLAVDRALGPGHVRVLEPVTVGEDFALYGRTEHKVPICLYRLGTLAKKAAGENIVELHSSHYAPDAESAINTGVKVMCQTLVDLF